MLTVVGLVFPRRAVDVLAGEKFPGVQLRVMATITGTHLDKKARKNRQCVFANHLEDIPLVGVLACPAAESFFQADYLIAFLFAILALTYSSNTLYTPYNRGANVCV